LWPWQTKSPAAEPIQGPTDEPTLSPTPAAGEPTQEPTDEPTLNPTPAAGELTQEPTDEPTLSPTPAAGEPTQGPTDDDSTFSPTPAAGEPTQEPTDDYSTFSPTPAAGEPTQEPTDEPTFSPTLVSSIAAGSSDDDYTGSKPLPISCSNETGTSTFCPGVLPASVAKIHLLPGCVLFSNNDLTFVAEVPKYEESSILVICASSESGIVSVDATTLADFDMVFENQSLISSVILGPDAAVTVYSGGNFDGNSLVIKQTSSSDVSLVQKVYGLGTRSANDNVLSLELASGSDVLNKCETAMQVYYYEEYMKMLSKKNNKVEKVAVTSASKKTTRQDRDNLQDKKSTTKKQTRLRSSEK